MKLEAGSPAALVLRDARAPPRGRLTLLRIANLVQLKSFTRSAMSATGTYLYTLALVFFTMDNGDQPFIDNWPIISTMAKQVRTKKRNLAG